MKIEFIPTQLPQTLLRPEPAIRHLPDWYKNLSPFAGERNRQHLNPDNSKDVTVKWCNPFGDALGAGYYIFLENEIQVRPGDQGPELTWQRGGQGFISSHSQGQIDLKIVPKGFSKDPLKFSNYYGIKTPKGYSVLFTHPLNRPELPFLTLSGIVDTDTYHNAVNFPFLLREDFDGEIAAGTPIAQVIPFKRESWQLEVAEYDEIRVEATRANYLRHFSRPYKRLHWFRKEWK